MDYYTVSRTTNRSEAAMSVAQSLVRVDILAADVHGSKQVQAEPTANPAMLLENMPTANTIMSAIDNMQ